MDREKLSRREIKAAFDADEMNARFPPILTIEQVAQMLQCSKSCVEKLSSSGKLNFAKSSRGPVRFWRDRVIAWIFGERGN
jgi:excisionase family DNA binding protein